MSFALLYIYQTAHQESMAKKKTKAREAALDEELGGITKQLTMLQIKAPSATQKQKKVDVREQWDAYFGPGDLEDFQRLCADLQIEGDLSSKTKCRKVSRVCLCREFLEAVRLTGVERLWARFT